MPKKFWQFRNQAAGSAELLLYGDISDSSWWGDEVTPKTFADELNALGALTSLTVRINSGGGDVFAAQTIGNLLEQHTAQVTARIDGLCASAATIIACHCDKVVAANDSTYMIHPVRMGIFDFADAVTLQQYINNDGTLNIVPLAGGKAASATTLTVTGKKLDPSKVKAADIVGGVDAATGKETGLEVVRQIYPKLSMTPGILLAPRFSMDATVAAALQAKTKEINGVFKAVCIVDIDSTESGATKYTDVKQRKEAQAVSDANAYAVWPCAKVGEVVYSGSALAAALTAYTDAVNADTPNVSPSNKTLAISAACLADGTEVVLDQEQANTVNGFGVATFLNMSGFRLWGNNTAAYPSTTDPKDRWFSVRRFLSWAANSFILTYFSKVDSPANKRLIEAIVDSENVRGNGFVARGVCARYEVIYDEAENTTADLLDGKITFHQYITPYTPAEDIEDVIEFDPDALTTALS